MTQKNDTENDTEKVLQKKVLQKILSQKDLSQKNAVSDGMLNYFYLMVRESINNAKFGVI